MFTVKKVLAVSLMLSLVISSCTVRKKTVVEEKPPVKEKTTIVVP
jgi:hypothetical protein